ncbi:MAG: argininosuccinate lyase [Deltaproteobacteria bacterium]|nr:argininosuccinate lyase [Deltaproteobacteria bacterium]
MKKIQKPWGGRFVEPTDRKVEEFTASIAFDRQLYRYDIEGSIAHCKMLTKQGIISDEEEERILTGLKSVFDDIEAGNLDLDIGLEDIHMAVEYFLTDRIGETGGKLHTGRSRNDQVTLGMRMYLRDEVKNIIELLETLQRSFHKMAKAEMDTIMPGYTHLQKAQPVLLSHYLFAYWEMFERDRERFGECMKRVNVMPLGSGALAGTGIPIDRQYVAQLLGFPTITANSMDAVSDRDFIAEFIFDAVLTMMHMSRFCEDLILWATEEFGYAEIADSFTTGSSIMPQKKNPDVAELIRGKTGRVYGNLMAVLTILKGLPMTYNRDLQEDKEPLFDTVHTIKNSLGILSEMAGKLHFNREKMRERALEGFSTATDMAEYLVLKGVAFRDAHSVVGKIVAYCIDKGKDLGSLSISELRSFYGGFDEDVYACLTLEASVNGKNITGGTSPQMVLKRSKEIDSNGA